MRRQLRVHAVANPLVDALPLDLGPRLRLAIDRARPPVEHALARLAGQRVAALQHRVEHRRRGAERAVEVQRLAEADDVLRALARAELLRIEPAEPIARVGEIVGRGALANRSR